MVQSTETPPADFQERPNGPQQLKGLVVDGNVAQRRRQRDVILKSEVVHLHCCRALEGILHLSQPTLLCVNTTLVRRATDICMPLQD